MEENKKVILIKGSKSRWFEQAIFIMKDKSNRKDFPKNFVAEAEKIINDYMMKKYSSENDLIAAYSTSCPKTKNVKKQNKKYDKILNISIVLCCVFIGFILYYFS